MDDHVVFFFGAGISRPTFKMEWDNLEGSQVDTITQKVLDAPLVYTENQRYVFRDSVENDSKIVGPHESSSEYVRKVQDFLDFVRQYARKIFNQFGREVTYEDLYTLCGEVVNDQEEKKLSHHSVNPAVRTFSEMLQEEFETTALSFSSTAPMT